MKLAALSFSPVAFAVIFGASLLTSCQKPEAEVVAESDPPAPSVAPPAPAATPAPATPMAVATPLPDPLAPPGIFFLLQKASITTDDGIIGLKPGQALRQVSPGTYEVNGHTVQLRDDHVTNNLRIARHYAAADAATQAARRQALQPAPTRAPVSSTAPVAVSTPAPRPISRPAPPPSTGLSGGARLGAGTGAADPETANRRNVKVDSSGRHYWRDSRGNIRYDF